METIIDFTAHDVFDDLVGSRVLWVARSEVRRNPGRSLWTLPCNHKFRDILSDLGRGCGQRRQRIGDAARARRSFSSRVTAPQWHVTLDTPPPKPPDVTLS